MKNFLVLIFLITISFHLFGKGSSDKVIQSFNGKEIIMIPSTKIQMQGNVHLETNKLLVLEDAGGGENVSIKVPTSVTSYVLQLPAAVSAANDILLFDATGVGTFGKISNDNIDIDHLLLTEATTTPSTPAAGKKKLYCLTDNKCYQLDDGGNEKENFFLNVDDSASFPTSVTISGTSTSGSLVLSPDVDQNITSPANTFIITRAHNEINPDADYVMTSTPTIPDGEDGQILILNNISNFTIDIQDESVLTGSNVQLGGSESAIRPKGAMTLFFSGDTGFWIVLSNPNSASLGANASILEVRNVSGSAISAGQVVYSTGFNVGQNRPTIDLADADDFATGEAIGFTATAISNNANGEVIRNGLISFNTSTAAVNDEVYVGTTPGAVVFSRPSVDRVQKLGIISRVNVNGRIIVRVEGPEDVPNIPSFTDFTNANHNHVDGASGGSIVGGAGAGGINALTDNSFEIDITNVVSTVGTITQDAVTFYHPISGGKSLKIALLTETADVEQIETQTLWEGTTVEVSCYIKSSSATVNLCSTDDSIQEILCVDYDGTDIWKKVVSSMIVPASGKMGWRITTDSNFSGNIFVDECSVTPLIPSIDAAIGGWETFTPTGSWTTNVTYTGLKRKVGDTFHYRVKIAISGGVDATTLRINLPDGEIDPAKTFADTEDKNLGIASYFDSGTGVISQGVRIGYSSVTQVIISTNGSSFTDVAPITWANGDTITMRFKAAIVGLSSSTQFLTAEAFTPVEGYWEDVNCTPDLGSTSDGNFQAITDSDCAFTKTTGTFTANNPASAIGGFTQLNAGFYDICFQFMHLLRDVNAPQWFAIFTCSGTSPCSSSDTMIAVVADRNEVTDNNTNRDMSPLRFCGIYQVNSSGNRNFNLLEKTGVVSTVEENKIYAAVDNRMVISIRQISGVMFAKLGDHIETPGAGAFTPVFFSAEVSSTDVVSKEYFDWITGDCTDATLGEATCTFESGAFSAEPNCQTTADRSVSNKAFCSIIYSGTASINIICTNTSTDAHINTGFSLGCHGYQ